MNQTNSPLLSQILAEFLLSDPKETIQIKNILEKFQGNSFLLTLIFFAIPGIIPLPPGMTIIIAIPLILLSLQMLLGYEKVILPKRLNEIKLKNSTLIKIANKAIPILQKIESFLKPRFSIITNILSKKTISIIIFLSAICVMNPLPFTHSVPSFAIIIISLSLIKADGLVMICGILIAFSGFGISAISIATFLVIIKTIFNFA
jgi:hypothetical protein